MKTRRTLSCCLLWAACLGLAACAGMFRGTYGQINPSADVTRAFESYQVKPDFRYYISGSDLYPNALMGLHKDYRLDPQTLWKEVEMTSPKMKAIVEYMKTKAFEYFQYQHGFQILDERGKPIGVWYSILTARTFVRMNPDGTVRIDTPDLDTYEKYRGKEGRAEPGAGGMR